VGKVVLTKIKADLVDIVFDGNGRATKIVDRIRLAQRIDFILALAGSEVSDVEGVSAAGSTPELRRQTPAIDADILLSHLTNEQKLPVSPNGIASPVVLTRAALSLIPHMTTIVDCGSFSSPQIEHIKAGAEPGKSITSGAALSLDLVNRLYEAGGKLADVLARNETERANQNEQEAPVVLAECVPGGTTTAQAIFMALGIEAENLLSSSVPTCNHEQKIALAKAGIKAAAQQLNIEKDSLTSYFKANPLAAIAAVGDPMQAFAVGFVSQRNSHAGNNNTSNNNITILGGGSQMLAVYALANQLASNQAQQLNNIMVATTKWVAQDKFAQTAKLARLVDAPFVASHFALTESGHAGLRAYEEGHVKEGVGAGATILLANLLARIDEPTILQTIDSFYTALT
nr:nicotinate-nucleotide--dimethylbenzimidazole phosphoribosyltransferase [bacterium]